MPASPSSSADENLDHLLAHLRDIRQQVQEHGPLPDDQRAEAADAFRHGLALLAEQVDGARGQLKGSGGQW